MTSHLQKPMKFSNSAQPRNLLLALLVILCCFTAFSSLTSDIALTKANYAGFVAVAACLLSYFVARQLFKRLLGLTLLLSVFHLLNFLPTAINIGLGFGELSVGIEPFSLLLLIGYYLLNRSSANAFVRRYVLPAPTPEKALRLQRESTDQFKQNFARKTNKSLRQIVQDRKLIADAIIAAQELLAERNSTAKPMLGAE